MDLTRWRMRKKTEFKHYIVPYKYIQLLSIRNEHVTKKTDNQANWTSNVLIVLIFKKLGSCAKHKKTKFDTELAVCDLCTWSSWHFCIFLSADNDETESMG